MLDKRLPLPLIAGTTATSYENGYRTAIVQEGVPAGRLAEVFHDHVHHGCDAIMSIAEAPGIVSIRSVFNKGAWHTRFWFGDTAEENVTTIFNPARSSIDAQVRDLAAAGAVAILYNRRWWPDSEDRCLKSLKKGAKGTVMTDTFAYKPPGSFFNI